jgi:hypothetical protein
MYLQLVATKQIVILLLAKEKNKKEIVATLLILSLPEPKEVLRTRGGVETWILQKNAREGGIQQMPR